MNFVTCYLLPDVGLSAYFRDEVKGKERQVARAMLQGLGLMSLGNTLCLTAAMWTNSITKELMAVQSVNWFLLLYQHIQSMASGETEAMGVKSEGPKFWMPICVGLGVLHIMAA